LKTDNVLQDKSYAFAIKIIQLAQTLVGLKELDIGRQVLKSGTSIGANVEEAIGSHTGKEFLYKPGIAYREARETHYWLRLLIDSNILPLNTCKPMKDDVEELLRIIGAIQKTLKRKQNPKSTLKE
jgi:four helix bundle protein